MQKTTNPNKDFQQVSMGMIGIFVLSAFIWIGKDLYVAYVTSDMTEGYSIATYTDYKQASIKGRYHYYFFIYQNQKVEGETIHPDVSRVGDRYLVRFWREKPEWSEVLEEYRITDTTLVPPPNGWDRIPIMK